MKKNVFLGIVLVLGIGTVWAYVHVPETPQIQATPSPRAANGQNTETPFVWSFESKGEDPSNSAPLTAVHLKTGNMDYYAGTYQGSCTVIDGVQWKLADGEKSGVICWFAGGGKDVGVFEQHGQDVIEAGDIEEGSEESAGFRGNYTTVLEVI